RVLFRSRHSTSECPSACLSLDQCSEFLEPRQSFLFASDTIGVRPNPEASNRRLLYVSDPQNKPLVHSEYVFRVYLPLKELHGWWRSHDDINRVAGERDHNARTLLNVPGTQQGPPFQQRRDPFSRESKRDRG